MENKEVDKQLIDDLIFYYVEKKRTTDKRYNYKPNEKYDEYFNEAAALCTKLSIHPAEYVQHMYNRMHDKKNFFSPIHLRGRGVEQYFKNLSESDELWKAEITSATIDIADVWQQQLDLAMRFVRRGEAVESVLLDSRIAFFAWFRILATPEKNSKIIQKYKKIAKQELNPRIIDFIKQENLDLDRLL
jgi:hypothetical protein